MDALAYVCIFFLSDAIVIAVVLEAYRFSSVHMLLKSQGGIAISYYKDFGRFFFLNNCISCHFFWFFCSVGLLCVLLSFEALKLEPKALYLLNR